MPQDRVGLFVPEPGNELGATRFGSETVILNELYKVLSAHPAGLRRWSVMQAIRNSRSHTGRAMPQNFEAEVERTFRRFCANVKQNIATALQKTPSFSDLLKRLVKCGLFFGDRASSWPNEVLVEVVRPGRPAS
jgi:hypothetical protein